jgi:hypothetical protein
MSHCPSQDWDRYWRDNELPEICICGKENWDKEKNDWVYTTAPGYCSAECEEKDQKRIQEEADAEAEWIKELENENK